MSYPNYKLEVISHHPDFKNRSLKKYNIEGIETVGAWGNEPFEIRFTNNTYQKIQVKISVDGTDILTGKPADTEITKDMWVVNGYGTLELKAWPETHNGGAQFIFTSANNSVAVHTHGDLSSRGIIAAAVFVEGHVEPIKYNPPIINHNHYHYPDYYPLHGYPYKYWIGGGGTYTSNSIIMTTPVTTYNSADNNIRSKNTFLNEVSFNATMDSLDCNVSESDSLEKLVSVGAGQHVNQKITYVQGLTKPLFTETVRVRYLWWDDLVNKLKSVNAAAPHASGFPGDKNQNIMNLGSTPRIGSQNVAYTKAAQPAYSRF